MLQKRLLLANMNKLTQPKVDEIEHDPMQNRERDVYLWNSGIIHSATSLTKVLGVDDGKIDAEGYDRTNRPEVSKALPELRVFSINHICQFAPDHEYIGSLTLQPLKEAKEELATAHQAN